MKTHYITTEYRVTYMPDGSMQYDRLLNGAWLLFSFIANDQGKGSEYDANIYMGAK